MSSLTSLGVNKNTTRFAPKPRRSRKPRKPKITPPLSDSEEDIKYPVIFSKKQLQYQQPPKNTQCAFLRDPPTPPFLQHTTLNADNRKIPTVVVEEDEESLPASPPEDTFKPEPMFLEEEMSLKEMKKCIREEKRMRSAKRTDKKQKKKKPYVLSTLDDIDYDPSSTVDPESTMSEHTRDSYTGIVSNSFKQVELARRKNIETERQKRRDIKIREIVNPYRKADSPRYKRDYDTLTESINVPQVRLVDGEIVLDMDSLTRQPIEVDHERQQREGELEVVEENEYTKKINSSTYSKRSNPIRWSQLETNDFYDALSQFGTDFEMISKILPGRTRQHVRLKFNKEEKTHPEKITEYLLRKRKLPDLAKYSAITGNELEEVPDVFMEEYE